MSIRKFEEFVGYGADEMDSKEWPSAAKAKYEVDAEKKFTKKDLMDAAYAFTDDATKLCPKTASPIIAQSFRTIALFIPIFKAFFTYR